MLHRAGWIWGARATADGVQSLARVVVRRGGGGGDASGWDGEGKGAVKPSGSSLREVRCQLGMVALLPWDRAEQGLLRPGGGSRVSAAGIGWPQNWGGGGDIQSWS